MITVANIRVTKIGEYVGRAMPRQRIAGSPLGNPFRLAKGQPREDVIEQYARYLRYILNQPRAGLTAEGRAMQDEIARLTELGRAGDLVLLCWCAPLSCHADVIKELIERAL